MARNIHQNRRTRHNKPAPKPAAQPVVIEQTSTKAEAPQVSRPAPARAAVQAMPMHFPELPSELRRIGLFTAFVVILLIVLWFFLR
jgi:hypothetical protein